MLNDLEPQAWLGPGAAEKYVKRVIEPEEQGKHKQKLRSTKEKYMGRTLTKIGEGKKNRDRIDARP
jgi:hypothetical protein